MGEQGIFFSALELSDRKKEKGRALLRILKETK